VFISNEIAEDRIALTAGSVLLQVIYTVLIVPISIARFVGYTRAHVPATFTFLADFIFALGGQLPHRFDLFPPRPVPLRHI
jgi:hypothetical protein